MFKTEAPLGTAQIASANFLNLLIVDDERSIREVCREVGQVLGFNTFVAESAENAYREMDIRPIDIVLLDLLMPRLDGFSVLEYLQQDPRYRDMPVIVLTAKMLTVEEKTLLQQRVFTVIQKQGLEPDALIQEVRSALQAYRHLAPNE